MQSDEPKLAVSGELDTAILSSVAHSSVNGSDIYLKFVVATNDDFDEVTRAVEAYKEAGVECPVHPWADVSKNIIHVKEGHMYGARLAPPPRLNAYSGNAWGT